jgi:hypothetical protein
MLMQGFPQVRKGLIEAPLADADAIPLLKTFNDRYAIGCTLEGKGHRCQQSGSCASELGLEFRGASWHILVPVEAPIWSVNPQVVGSIPTRGATNKPASKKVPANPEFSCVRGESGAPPAAPTAPSGRLARSV